MKRMYAAAALCLGACGTIDKKEPPPMPFTGTKWQVVLELPQPGEQPWVQFGDGRMQGFGGCNRIGADYLQDSVGSRFIAIKRIELSGRVCESHVVASERRILAVLQDVSSYAITAGTMKMSGSAGTLVLKGVSAEAR